MSQPWMSLRLAWPIKVRRLSLCKIQKWVNVVLKITLFLSSWFASGEKQTAAPGIISWDLTLVILVPKDHEGEGCGVISTRIISLILLNQRRVLLNLSNCPLCNWNLNRDYPGKDQWDASCSGAGHDLWHSWHTCHWTRPEQDWCPRCYAGEWNCSSFSFAFLQPRGYETCPGAGVTLNQQVHVTERSPTEQNTSADLQGTEPGRSPSNLLLLMYWLNSSGGDCESPLVFLGAGSVLGALEASCLLSALCGIWLTHSHGHCICSHWVAPGQVCSTKQAGIWSVWAGAGMAEQSQLFLPHKCVS